jgi:hypothetical protein
MEDAMEQFRQELAVEKARLDEAFERELAEHRERLNAEKAKEIAALKAALESKATSPPAYPPPPPPPPPRDVHLTLLDDLSNLPGRRAALPTSLTFRGQTTRDRERMKVILTYARSVKKLPGSIMTDPLEDLQEVIARVRGPRTRSPSTEVARSRSGARRPPRPRSRGSVSRSRGRSPPRRSRSPIRRPPSSDDLVTDRFRQIERRLDEVFADVKLIKEQIRQQEENRRWKTVHRASLQARTAPPRVPGSSGAPVRNGENSSMEDELSPEGKML